MLRKDNLKTICPKMNSCESAEQDVEGEEEKSQSN